ncbi:MAG: HIT domain-containing protein [Actinobacteria bacterium]|nr:HIT domain-containing protein [Actinomycetota bacterium]
MPECLFCAIVAGDIPADIVLRTDSVVAFRDIDPKAPTHILVVPTEHHSNVGELSEQAPEAAAAVLQAAAEIARMEDLAGYRLVFNTGAEAGQSVFHVHGHVLGGRSLTWPPG